MGVTDPNITRPIFDYPPDEFLNSLGAYDTWEGGDILLDLPRAIVRSGKYFFMGTAFPTGNDTLFAALSSFSGNVSIPPYSYLVSLTAYNSLVPQQRAASIDYGFKLSIYDKGAQTQIFQNTFAWKTTAGGMLPQQYSGGYNQTVTNPPMGPHFFTSPMIILPPGSLQIEITNLANADDIEIQILLGFAVPVTNTNTGKTILSPTQ